MVDYEFCEICGKMFRTDKNKLVKRGKWKVCRVCDEKYATQKEIEKNRFKGGY